MNPPLVSQFITQKKDSLVYKPEFFRIGNEKEKESLFEILRNKPHIQIFNEIQSQLKDLIKLRRPREILDSDQVSKSIAGLLGNTSPDDYGVWVYYPWSERLVHILDEAEYTEVRTNRNIYKISPEEIKLLATKKIGLIGLSVGQSVALTLALERGFGELRIADFDELELTNLNRIRTGVHNLGINKSVSVAREIAEIDPYLKVNCFIEGITEENLDRFFTGGGKLDVLIDECDGFDIKIICRQIAKKYAIPVLMEASDRGMVDVERFDLEPNRPLLHGLIDHLDISKIKTLKTNEEKVPYLLPFVGIDTISDRAKASMLEIGETITTWPQLASAVTLGGGITADVCRRILLNQFQDSGRYYVDVEEIIGNPKKADSKKEPQPITNTFLNQQKIQSILSQYPSGSLDPKYIVLNSSQIDSIIDKALLAPSAGNNQPWIWFYRDKSLFLFHDKERTASFLDFNHFISQIGLGTSLENVILEAGNQGLGVNIEYYPLGAEKDLVAVCHFYSNPTFLTDPLVHFIGKRFTNRKINKPLPIEREKIQKLILAAENLKGVKLDFIVEPDEIREISSIIAFCERERFMDYDAHQEFFNHELKWTSEQAEKDRIGIDLRTTDLSLSDIAGLRITRNWEVIELLKKWKVGKGLEKLSRKVVAGASSLGLLTIQATEPEKYILGGRAVERAWLEATQNQVSMQPLLAPLSYFQKKNSAGEFLDEDIRNILNQQELKLRQIFKVPEGNSLVFLFRIFEAEEPTIKSLRLDRGKLFINDSEFSPQGKV